MLKNGTRRYQIKLIQLDATMVVPEDNSLLVLLLSNGH